MIAGLRGQAQHLKLVFCPSGNEATEISLTNLRSSWCAHTEGLTLLDGKTRPGVAPQRYRKAGRLRTADAAPGGSYSVGTPFCVIGSHKKNRCRSDEGLRSKRNEHITHIL
jgi:hypothetical protein